MFRVIYKSKLASYVVSLFLLTTGLCSCKKLVSIPEPVNSITTVEVFSTEEQANSALTGIYTQMINQGTNVFFCSGALRSTAGCRPMS